MIRTIRTSGLLVASLCSLLTAAACGGGEAEPTPDAQPPPDTGEEQLAVQLSLADDTPVGTGTATLTRFREHLELTGSVDTIPEGESFTVWWRIFGSPSRCMKSSDATKIRCSEADLENENADPAFGYCAGFASTAGPSTFACERAMSDGPFAPDADGNGAAGELLFPEESEVHLVIRTHGPTLTGALATAQLETYMGGCKVGEPNDGMCADIVYFPFIFCSEGHGVVCP